MISQSTKAFYTLISREFYRFMRLFSQTVVPPLITTVMFILIFGYSLGSHIKEINGVKYILFILPGLIQMSVINNAYANSSTSLFMARLERSIENLMATPLHLLQIVASYIIGAILRGVVVGLTIFVCASIFVDFPEVHYGFFVMSMIVTSMLFGSLGVISALFAETWDQIATFTNFVITPFTYLGGVFYSIHMLPPIWQKISAFNPIFYCVDLMRYAFLNQSDVNVYYSLTIVCLFAAFVIGLCLVLFHRGYKLVK